MSHKKFADSIPSTQIVYMDGGAAPTLHLHTCKFVVHGPDGPREEAFNQSVISIGATEDNDLIVTDSTVSRSHCRVIREESGYILKDLASTNGSFINGVRVREAWLAPGSEFRLGQCRLSFHPYDETVTITPAETERFGDIIGRDVRMREIFGMLEKIAPTGATVVIEGETGTGKEVVAQTIHKTSPRASKPFIVFDCGAVPESLIESELFGHEKGSFTGAIGTRQGLFETAQGGTIFLDELGELSLDLQPKLLRVLEQREVRRIGSTRAIPINVRVLAATNRDLAEEVRAGRFREDLFYRLSVVRLHLPPLRDRRDDIPLLIDHFLSTHAYNRDPATGRRKIRRLTPAATHALLNYHWPGNIRELVNVIERGCSFAEGDVIDLTELPRSVLGHPHQPGVPPVSAEHLAEDPDQPPMPDNIPHPDDLHDMTFKKAKEEWISSFERDYILTLLERNDNNISHAAREAEIDRKYFRKLMKKYDIEIS